MALERWSICHASAANVYVAFRDSSGKWFDFSDSAWKTNVADVVQPGPSTITETAIAGRGLSQYHADVDLELLNATPRRLAVFADWRVKAGASRSLTADTAINRASDPFYQIRCGLLEPDVSVAIIPCFDPEGGSGTGRAHFGVTVLANGSPIDMKTLEPTSACGLIIKQQGSNVADITASASEPDDDGRFDLFVDDPGLIDNRNYHAVATVTLGDSSTLVGADSFPIAG